MPEASVSAPVVQATAPAQAASPSVPDSGAKAAVASKAAVAAKVAASPETAKAALTELAAENMDSVVTIKINGQVRTMPVKDALKLAEKAGGADQRLEQAALALKQNQQFVAFARQAKENPDLFFREFGIDPDQYSQSRLATMLQKQMLSPEQRQLQELQEENSRFKETEKQRVAREAQEKEASQLSAIDSQLKQEIFTAWESSGLPPDPSFGIEIAKMMIASEMQGLNWTAAQAAAKVKENFLNTVHGLSENMDAEAIQSLLSKSALKKIREFEVSRVSAQNAGSKAKSQSPGQKPASSSPSKMLSEREYKAWFAARAGS